MSSRWIHVTYLSVAGVVVVATVAASMLMWHKYHVMQLAIIWLLGFINSTWPVAFLLQYRVDRTNNSGYDLAIQDRKTPVIIVIVLNAIAIGMAAWMLQKPLG